MTRPLRVCGGVAMAPARAGLLYAAAAVPAARNASAKFRTGGTLKIDDTSDVDAIDPALAYGTTSWWFEIATGARLFNYPDKSPPQGNRLVPEVASGVKIGNGGQVYTFTIRKGFRFSDGAKVTAKNFQYAINRNLQSDIQSPVAQFITDPNGSNIV